MMLFSEFSRQNQEAVSKSCQLTAATDIAHLHRQTQPANPSKKARHNWRAFSTQDVISFLFLTLCRTANVQRGRLWCRQVYSSANV